MRIANLGTKTLKSNKEIITVNYTKQFNLISWSNKEEFADLVNNLITNNNYKPLGPAEFIDKKWTISLIKKRWYE